MYPIVKEYLSSDQTVNEVSSSYGIKPCVLHYWRRKYLDETEVDSGFIPMGTLNTSALDFEVELQTVQGTLVRFRRMVPAAYLRSIIGH